MVEQNKIIKKPVIVAIGELLWDLLPGEKQPGGAPSNVAFHADQLGMKGVICSCVGDDKLGRELVHVLKKSGLTTDYIQEDKTRPTGVVDVDVQDVTQPKYSIHDNVAWDNIVWNDDLKKTVEKAAAICFGTLAQRSKASRETIQKCLRYAPQAIKIYDANIRQHFYEKEWIEFSLDKADIIKVNMVEAITIGKLFGFDCSTPLKFARQAIDQFNVKLVCVTRSNRGSVFVTTDQAIDIPGISVKVVDTIGAGDAFIAALIYARLNKWPMGKTAKFANNIGALVATKSGAMPVLKEEFEAIKSKIIVKK